MPRAHRSYPSDLTMAAWRAPELLLPLPSPAGRRRSGRGAQRSRRSSRLELVWRVEVPKHRKRHLWRYGLEEKPKGFQVIPRRWVVERTFAWLSRSRRLARDYERLPETGEAMIYAAMSRFMLRRVAA